MKLFFDLFFTMLKIGAFTFGGGYAMIALLESELVTKKGWIEREEFLDIVAIAESTPGPIAINMATYIGYKRRGVLGAIVATLAICIPSLVIVYAISLFFDAFISFEIVYAAFRGIQACVLYLILSAGIRLFKKIKKTPINVVILSSVVVCTFVLSLFAVKFSSVFYILICGGLGVLLFLIKSVGRKDGEANE